MRRPWGWTSVWNLGQRTRLWRKRVPHTTQIGGNSYYSQVGGLSFSPDGKSLASLARALTLFRVSDGASKPVIKEERIDSSPVPILIPQRLGGIWVSFLADGKILILWNGYTRFGFMGWDSSERRILGENWKVSYDRRKSGPRPPSVLQAVVSADRSVMVVDRSGPIVEVWNLRNLWPR